MTPRYPLLAGLPGEDLILKGLADLTEGRKSIETCLVRIAANHLSRAGMLPPGGLSPENAELDLYAFLAPFGDNAHSKYNALIRQLISFEQALDHRLTRAA
jgi:hypothetical protein